MPAATDSPWLKFLAALFALAAATLLAVWFKYGLGVPRVGMIYLLSIVLVSYRYGARYGLFVAILATLSYDFFIEGPRLALSFGVKQDIFNIVVFSASALLTGTYTEQFRERQAALSIIGASRIGARAEHGGYRVLQKTLGKSRISVSMRGEAWRALSAICLSACGLAVAMALHAWFGVQYLSGILLATVLLVAGSLGSSPGLLAAIFCVFAFDYVFVGSAYALDLTSPEDLVNFGLFAGTGWAAGMWADRLRNQQQVIRLFLAAEQGIFAAGGEEDIRSTLQNVAQELLETKFVWVLAEDTKAARTPDRGLLPDELVERVKTLDPGQTAEFGPWCMRALNSSTQRFGTIVWVPHGRNAKLRQYRIRGVAMLADLAAVAMSQARATAEKMEEHLAARSDRLRNTLLSSVSHDFRTPLAGILTSVTALIEQGDRHNKNQREAFLVNIKTQAMRLNRYVENLLGIVRVDSGTLHMQCTRVHLEPLVYSAWDALTELGADSRVLHVQIPPDATVVADPTLLTQVLQNVLENAIKFSPEYSIVLVRSTSAADRQDVEVLDEGNGVDAADMPFIFDRFYRSKAATAAGTGLGLFIVKGMLEAMNASVKARPRTDGKRGLSISISLKNGEVPQ